MTSPEQKMGPRPTDQRIRDVQDFGEEGGVVPVIDLAATSTFLNPLDMEKTFHGELKGCYLYSRHSNPTVNAFGRKFAALEGTEAALGVASGMAAISCVIDQLVQAGDHIVTQHAIYGGTYALFKNVLPRRGVSVTFVDLGNPAEVEKAIQPGKTKVIYAESLSNPLLRTPDFSGLKALKEKYHLKLVVDGTFAPLMLLPTELGADVVVHSCTKYISGASDMIAGVIASSAEMIASLIDVNSGSVMLGGAVMDARIAHELYLRLDHLPVRIRAHSEAAQFLAERMRESGVKVTYPGLKNHPQRSLIDAQFNTVYGYGGMLTVDCGTSNLAMELASELQKEKFGLYAVSLGFSRTLMSCPAVSTSSEIPEEEQKQIQLSPGLLRLSIGLIGDHEVLWKRFLKSYQKVMPKGQ